MGPWLVLVSPCFRENVDATCKIWSFCVVKIIYFRKNVIVCFFVCFFLIKFQNGAHLKKGLFLTYFLHFVVTREKLQKFLQHISHSHTYTYICSTIDFFCLTYSHLHRKFEAYILFKYLRNGQNKSHGISPTPLYHSLWWPPYPNETPKFHPSYASKDA